MANIVGCEVFSLENYYKSEQVKDFKYDEFNSLDLALLSMVRDIRILSFTTYFLVMFSRHDFKF